MTPFELIDKAVEAGAQVVQFGDNMPLERYDDDYLKEIKAYAVEKNIELEAGMREMTKDRLLEYIRITKAIGASLLRIVIDGKHGFEPTIEEIISTLKSVIPTLEENGVTLGIENHDRFRSETFADIVRAANHPQIGLTVDTVNSLSIEEPVDVVLANMAPYCVCLHLKDYTIVRNNGGNGLFITGACPGKGRLDIARCIEACSKRAGRDFNIILESWMAPQGDLETSLVTEDQWVKEGIRFAGTVLPAQGVSL